MAGGLSAVGTCNFTIPNGHQTSSSFFYLPLTSSYFRHSNIFASRELRGSSSGRFATAASISQKLVMAGHLNYPYAYRPHGRSNSSRPSDGGLAPQNLVPAHLRLPYQAFGQLSGGAASRQTRQPVSNPSTIPAMRNTQIPIASSSSTRSIISRYVNTGEFIVELLDPTASCIGLHDRDADLTR